MKKIKQFTMVLIAVFAIQCYGQTNDETKIKTVIANFSKAGDTNNTAKLESCLDHNYRIIMNQLFGSADVTIMLKREYLKKIESKEFGGDKRSLEFMEIVLNGNTATAKVLFKGSKMTATSLITLVKHKNGQWKLINDVPVI